MADVIQNIVFNKKIWSIIDSANYCLNNGYKVIKIDETDDLLYFRQVCPLVLKKAGYTYYKAKRLNHGIKAVIAYCPIAEGVYALKGYKP